ncbi:MAG: hypothetical protein LC776_07155, partial [Acidobacteria bacterium]|nr:hypothetical protein [Acidobacteriota bacterium]
SLRIRTPTKSAEPKVRHCPRLRLHRRYAKSPETTCIASYELNEEAMYNFYRQLQQLGKTPPVDPESPAFF